MHKTALLKCFFFVINQFNFTCTSDLHCNERASLARATRVVIHFIFALGPSSLGMGESYF